MTLEDSLNNCCEQVFLLFLSNSELSKDELTQSILAVFLFYFLNNEIVTFRRWAFFNCILRFIQDWFEGGNVRSWMHHFIKEIDVLVDFSNSFIIHVHFSIHIHKYLKPFNLNTN